MDFPRWSAVVGVVIWRCRTAFDVGALVGADKAQMESKGGRHTSQAIRQISSSGDNFLSCLRQLSRFFHMHVVCFTQVSVRNADRDHEMS